MLVRGRARIILDIFRSSLLCYVLSSPVRENWVSHFCRFQSADYLIVGDVAGGFDFATLSNKLLALSKFLATVLAVFSLCVGMFLLGQKLGELLNGFSPLIGYSINIAGSLVGVLIFSAISFAGWSPLAWFAIGFALVIGFLPNWKSSALVFAATLLIIGIAPGKGSWSPYYRIDLSPIRAAGGDSNSPVVGYDLGVNHDYFQRMLDLSKDAIPTEFTERGRAYYNLIYQFVQPEAVLVVGAGSGNDVAAALRNRAKRGGRSRDRSFDHPPWKGITS